jgi:protein SCO1/2
LLTLVLSLVTAFVLPGCRHAGPAASQDAAAKRYPVQGKVMGVNMASGEVELDAAAIPGFMGAMTMPYKLKDPAVLSELHAGDTLRATLVVTDTSDVLDEIVVTGESKPVAAPAASDLQPLVPGEVVPNFALLNQDGRTVHLDQYRGRVLLVTFVYTRCPLADYCPRMSRNFAAVDKALAADPLAYAKTHLLSISVDPKYDTPAVLRSYGGAYTGNYTHETFKHWEFAAPAEQDLSKVLKFFDVAATPEQNRTVTHSLSTIVIGADGKVYRWYGTNEWTPAELVADVKKALGQGA